MHVNGSTLEREVTELESSVRLGIEQMRQELLDGLGPLLRQQTGQKHFIAVTSQLRWHWQDQIAKAVKEYVKQLWAIAERHATQRVGEWIEGRVREVFQDIIWQRQPLIWELWGSGLKLSSDNDLDLLKSQRLPPTPKTLKGELRIWYKGELFRLPITLSTHLRFLEATILRDIDARVRLKQHPDITVSDRHSPHWVFQRRDNGWSVGYPGRISEFPNLLGMTYLQLLLRNSEKDIPVEELIAAARTPPGRSLNPEALAIDNPMGHEIGQEILDDRTKREFRLRLNILKQDALIAAQTGNRDRLTEIREETAFIEAELKRGTGLRGRHRTFTTSADRQRVSVRKAAANAVSFISRRLPEIGDHLKASIKFGYKCSYRPSQKRDWHF